MSVEQAFSYGALLVVVMVGAGVFGWDQAMRFSRKLQRHGVDLGRWHADRRDRPVDVAASEIMS